MRRSGLHFIQWGTAAAVGTVVPPRRKRQFNMKEGFNASQVRGDAETVRQKPLVSGSYHPPGGITRPLSQREAYRASLQRQQEALCSRGIPGEWMTPLPPRIDVDEHSYEAPRATKEERRALMQQALERNAASVVEFTDGGEEDVETHGMNSSDFHSQDGWTTIPRESALYSTVIARDELQSRTRHNSWSLARVQRRRTENAVPLASPVAITTKDGTSTGSDAVIDVSRRRRLEDEGSYTNVFGGGLLEPNYESIGQPRSTYGMRKLFVAGLTGYQGMITREEEALMCEELVLLLQDRRAAYIAEETRYCVNLYEKELGIPDRDTLAFALDRAPTLQSVLGRFFHLGLIPSPPNICQVNEMIGNFSGYPVHKKPHTVGPYVGIMNLVSTTVMHMQHEDCPWFPRIHMNPRSLFVVEQPCLGEYKMGYKQTHQPFHAFEYATRVSKDYRIEVMFATVEVAHVRCLRDAVGLTEYAQTKGIDGGFFNASSRQQRLQTSDHSVATTLGTNNGREGDASLFSGCADKWIERLQQQLHATEISVAGSAEVKDTSTKAVCVDGYSLRERLLAAGSVGTKPRSFEASVAQEGRDGEPMGEQNGSVVQSKRRMMALKARYEFAKKLKEERGPTLASGMRVIKGHTPPGGTRL